MKYEKAIKILHGRMKELRCSMERNPQAKQLWQAEYEALELGIKSMTKLNDKEEK